MTREVFQLVVTNFISLIFGIIIGVGIAIRMLMAIARSNPTAKVTP